MYLQYNKSRHALISINHFNTHHITYTHIPLGSASGTTLYPIHEDLSQWFYIVYIKISRYQSNMIVMMMFLLLCEL